MNVSIVLVYCVNKRISRKNIRIFIGNLMMLYLIKVEIDSGYLR